MIKSVIVAMGKNRVIGDEGKLPWHIPADLKHFRQLTLGHPVAMGRKTFESIGRALPDRMNIVITRNPGYTAEGCDVVGSVDEAIQKASGASELFFIGGAEIYRQVLDLADRIYLTLIDKNFKGDAYFPNIDTSDWETMHVQRLDLDDAVPYALWFITMSRKKYPAH